MRNGVVSVLHVAELCRQYDRGDFEYNMRGKKKSMKSLPKKSLSPDVQVHQSLSSVELV